MHVNQCYDFDSKGICSVIKNESKHLGRTGGGDVVFSEGEPEKKVGDELAMDLAKPSDTLISSFKLLFVQETFYFKKCLVRINRAKLSAYQFLLDGATGYVGRGELLVV